MENYYEVDKVVEVLQRGGLILYPTDTIWGIGCDATNAASVEQIFTLKCRPINHSLIILVDSIEMLQQYVPDLHPRLETLLVFHQRPLTVIYEHTRYLPEILLGDNGGVGIRITTDEFCRQVIRKFGKPIVSSSANVSGEPYPTHFGVVSSEIIEGVDYVVRHRQKEKQPGEPSVIVRLSADAELEVIRE